MLLVEDMPAEERIRKGNVIYRTRMRDVEDTVAQLLHDEDQSIAVGGGAAGRGARAVVARRRSRARARASRRPRSARLRSGVVGAGRQSRARPNAARSCGRSRCRRSSWPIACAACRCSISRTSTSCSGWRGWAGRCATKRAARSTSAASAVHSMQFLLDGRVTIDRRRPRHRGAGGARLRRTARGLADARPPITAAERSITLSLTADEFLALLSENVELAEGIFRMLITRAIWRPATR